MRGKENLSCIALREMVERMSIGRKGGCYSSKGESYDV